MYPLSRNVPKTQSSLGKIAKPSPKTQTRTTTNQDYKKKNKPTNYIRYQTDEGL